MELQFNGFLGSRLKSARRAKGDGCLFAGLFAFLAGNAAYLWYASYAVPHRFGGSVQTGRVLGALAVLLTALSLIFAALYLRRMWVYRFAPRRTPLYRRLAKQFGLNSDEDFQLLDQQISHQVSHCLLAKIGGDGGRWGGGGIMLTQDYIIMNFNNPREMVIVPVATVQWADAHKKLGGNGIFWTVDGVFNLHTQDRIYSVNLGDASFAQRAKNLVAQHYEIGKASSKEEI